MVTVDPVLNVPSLPIPAASPSGLYSVATLVDEERPVVWGVDVPAPIIGGHGLWPEVCKPGDRVKKGGDSPATVRFPGTAVWAVDDCRLVGSTDAEARGRAEETLRAVESVEVERHVAALLKERATSPGGDLMASESVLLAEGIRPVVHVRPSDVPSLLSARALTVQSGVLKTVLGSAVAVGAGYETALDGVYVTGGVTVFRNPVNVYEAVSPSTNTRMVVAERGVAVAWRGQVVKISKGVSRE